MSARHSRAIIRLMNSKDICPCGNNKPYTHCCEPLHTLKQKPRTVKQLVRARYCAYARGAGNHREFLIRSWHPSSAKSISVIDITNDTFTWKGLNILRAEQRGDMARVEFKAVYSESEGGPDKLHHEVSLFHRVKGSWLYLEGKVNGEQP